jgi:hypothetical protein
MEASGPLNELRRSEEVVVRGRMEWRPSSASPRGKWEALGDERRSPVASAGEKIAGFVRDGKYMSQLGGDKRAQFGRRSGARGSSDALKISNEENQRLRNDLYALKNELQRAKYRIEALEAQIKELSEKSE